MQESRKDLFTNCLFMLGASGGNTTKGPSQTSNRDWKEVLTS